MSITQAFNNYNSQFPTQLPIKMGQSFVASIALGTLFGATAKVAIVAGAIAATITLIDAIARPIIRSIFPENPEIGMCSSLLLAVVSTFGMANAAAPLIGFTYKITAPLSCVFGFAALNQQDPYRANRAMAIVV